MYLLIVNFLMILDLIKNINAYTLLRTDLVNKYIEQYVNNIYLEENLIKYIDGDLFVEENGNIERSILKIHGEKIIEQLGGNARLIELLKLVKNNKEEEEEDSLDEGMELRDYFDKNLLTSNLYMNYYYINNMDINEDEKNHIGTNTFEIKFKKLPNIFGNNFDRRTNDERFELILNYIEPKNILNEVKVELTKKEIDRYKNNELMKFTNGYYLIKKRINNNFKNNGIRMKELLYRLKIESPVEMIDFNELIILNEMKLFFNKFNDSDDEYDEQYDSVYRDIELNRLLTNSYPICELKCVIKELQNKIQWSNKINKLMFNNGDNNIEIIKGYNWCNRLIFHNCIDVEIESLKIEMMNDKLLNKIESFENNIDKEINYQIEKYFLNEIEMINLNLDSKIIGKLVILNELLEKNGFIITKNGESNIYNTELLIKYDKISNYSKNIISLKEILNNKRMKLKINDEFEFNILNSSEKYVGTEKKYSIIPIANQKLVFDMEQVVGFIQNILFLLRKEKSSENKIILPWYNYSENAISKQNKYIRTLFSEYNILLKLLINHKFIGQDRFYRMNLLNTFSLISHFKSFEINQYTNLDTGMYLRDTNYYVVNTSLSYFDQIKINNIFRKNKTYVFKNIDDKIFHPNIFDFKLIREYYTHSYNEDNIYSIYEDELYKEKLNIEEKYPANETIEIPKLFKKIIEIKGNLDIDLNNIVFGNNIGNFGFNIAFINYIYQNSINMDDIVISSPPWWMIWQYQLYPKLSLINGNENEINIFDHSSEYFKNINSTWLELPVNSEVPNTSFDLGSFIPRDIISKEMLESIILEEVELINPSYKSGIMNSKDVISEIKQIIKEKQQIQINSWKKSDIINDPNNLLFYNLNNEHIKNKINFNPCIFNILNEINNSQLFSNCVKKWKIYLTLFDHFHSTINHYFHLSTFFDLIGEIKTILIINKVLNN